MYILTNKATNATVEADLIEKDEQYFFKTKDGSKISAKVLPDGSFETKVYLVAEVTKKKK